MRLAVYTDYQYRREHGRIYAERAFALFLVALAEYVDQLVIVGKVNPTAGASHYEIPEHVAFVELPFYERLTRPVQAIFGMARSLSAYWRALDQVDATWVLGPHPLGIAFVAMAAVRGKSVALGVRQDFPSYVRARHPGRPWIHAVGDGLEWIWRQLGRIMPVVAVGPDIAAAYPAGRTLEIAVSLVRARDIAEPDAVARDYETGSVLTALSVGRLEAEKNPLLLADILSRLQQQDPRWRLKVCGEGPMEGELRTRLAQFGVERDAELLGYVAHDRGLREIYRESHVLLHVSWTEGLPQVLFEAFAARLPVVATAVGGVPAAAGDAAVLIEPGDAVAAADALQRVAADPQLRERLVQAGIATVTDRTLDAEARRVARHLNLSRKAVCETP